MVRRTGAVPRISSSEATIPMELGRTIMARGMKITLTASATGTPTPTIGWYKNGKQIRNSTRFLVGNDGSLIIRKFSRRDAGSYEVRAVNSVGQDSDAIDVQLGGTVIPKIDNALCLFCSKLFCLDRPRLSRRQSVDPMATVPDTDMTFFPGQWAQIIRGRTVTFVVGVSGNPTPYVYWLLPSGRRLNVGQTYGRFSVAENGDLRISNVNPRDSGRYQVFASNFAGMDEILNEQKTLLTVYGMFRRVI